MKKAKYQEAANSTQQIEESLEAYSQTIKKDQATLKNTGISVSFDFEDLKTPVGQSLTNNYSNQDYLDKNKYRGKNGKSAGNKKADRETKDKEIEAEFQPTITKKSKSISKVKSLLKSKAKEKPKTKLAKKVKVKSKQTKNIKTPKTTKKVMKGKTNSNNMLTNDPRIDKDQNCIWPDESEIKNLGLVNSKLADKDDKLPFKDNHKTIPFNETSNQLEQIDYEGKPEISSDKTNGNSTGNLNIAQFELDLPLGIEESKEESKEDKNKDIKAKSLDTSHLDDDNCDKKTDENIYNDFESNRTIEESDINESFEADKAIPQTSNDSLFDQESNKIPSSLIVNKHSVINSDRNNDNSEDIFENEAYENKSFENEAYENESFENEAYENESFENEAYENESFEKDQQQNNASLDPAKQKTKNFVDSPCDAFLTDKDLNYQNQDSQNENMSRERLLSKKELTKSHNPENNQENNQKHMNIQNNKNHHSSNNISNINQSEHNLTPHLGSNLKALEEETQLVKQPITSNQNKANFDITSILLITSGIYILSLSFFGAYKVFLFESSKEPTFILVLLILGGLIASIINDIIAYLIIRNNKK